MSNIPTFIIFNDSRVVSITSENKDTTKRALISAVHNHMIDTFIAWHNHRLDLHAKKIIKLNYNKIVLTDWFPESYRQFSDNCLNVDSPRTSEYFYYQSHINNSWTTPWTQQYIYSQAREFACSYLTDKINNPDKQYTLFVNSKLKNNYVHYYDKWV